MVDGFDIGKASGDYYARTELANALLNGVNLEGADLSYAKVGGIELREADLSRTNLRGLTEGSSYLGLRDIVANETLEVQAKSLRGATLPDGKKYEEWLKSKGRGEDG